jgi:hypothetical protein
MQELGNHIEAIITGVLMAIGGIVGVWQYLSRRKQKEVPRERRDTLPPGTMLCLALALGVSGCGLFGSAEPTVRALTPVLVQVAEHVANRGLELAELPAQCEWEQDVDDADKLLVMCTVDTRGRR